jgi:hypothetical protein
MAYRLGISRSYYNAVECGRRLPGKWLQKSIDIIGAEIGKQKPTKVDEVHVYAQEPDLKVVSEPKHSAGRDEVITYLEPWFTCIDSDPNAAPYVLTQLRKHLPHGDIELFMKGVDTK